MKKSVNSQFNDIIAFANSSFSTNRKINFLEIQPKIYKHPEYSSNYHYVYEVENKIVGLIAVYPTKYQGLNFLGIGTVCVDIKHRNQGIMQKMFNDLEEELKQYDLIYLSGDKTRYERFGFYKTAKFIKFRIKSNDNIQKNYKRLEINAYIDESKIINKKLYELYLEKSIGVERRFEIFIDSLKTNLSEIYLVEDKGYIVYNPNKNIIYEIIVDDSKLEEAIYSFMRCRNLNEVYFELSLDDKRISKMYEISEDHNIQTMMNIRIVNYVNVIKVLLSKKKDLISGKVVIEVDSTLKLLIEVNDEIVVKEVLNENVDLHLTSKEFYALLFDDFTLFYPHINNKLELIKSWFMLHLPVTLHSIDSI